MSVFQGLLDGKTWQPEIVGTPGAALADGKGEGEGAPLGDGDGDGASEPEGNGLGLGLRLDPLKLAPGGFMPAPAPPLQATTAMKRLPNAKAANHLIYSLVGQCPLGSLVRLEKCDGAH